jgi:hypothetical protein
MVTIRLKRLVGPLYGYGRVAAALPEGARPRCWSDWTSAVRPAIGYGGRTSSASMQVESFLVRHGKR